MSTTLRCPTCEAPLRDSRLGARCRNQHRFPAIDGYIDLLPDDDQSGTASVFETVYGRLYDGGVQRPTVARASARVLWGAELREMYELMERGAHGHGLTIVDVPVGGAPVLRQAGSTLNCEYVGVDLSHAMLRRAADLCKKRGIEDAVLIRADATHLPFADASVDRILCFNGLHVIPDKEAVVAEFARVLRPGGEIWGSVLVRPRSRLTRVIRPWTIRPFWFFHPADAEALAAMAHSAGFKRWKQTDHGAVMIFRGRR